MIKLTDSSGNLFPAIRNLLNLIWLTVGLVLGWGGNIVWNRQAEADQLYQDAKAMFGIRAETRTAKENLDENIEDAIKLKTDCGNATDVEFVRELRKDRDAGQQSDD